MKKGPNETSTPRSRATACTSASEPGVSWPRSASKATEASQPPLTLRTCSTRVITAPGRLAK